MKRVSSEPTIKSVEPPSIVKSVSTSSLNLFEPFTVDIEGDGPLGLKYYSIEDDIYIKSIKKGTVSDEFFEIYRDLQITKINNLDISAISNKEKIDLIESIWITNNKIVLEFKNGNFSKEIYDFLDNLDALDYYKQFIDLGANALSDLEFIEEDDLIKMNMSKKLIKMVISNINSIYNK